MTSRRYEVAGKCVMVLAIEMDREWTPEEYVAAITALKGASPVDSIPAIEMVRIVTPDEVPETDDCTVHLTVHPRFAAKQSEAAELPEA